MSIHEVVFNISISMFTCAVKSIITLQTIRNKYWVAIPVKWGIWSLKRWISDGNTFFLPNNIFCGILKQIYQCCKKCKTESRNTDSSATLKSEWIYDKPSRPVNNGCNQEYEDMSLVRTSVTLKGKWYEK